MSTLGCHEMNLDEMLTLPGTGRFPVTQLIEMLCTDQYSGAICLEWERQWQPWAPPLREALRSLRDSLTLSFA